MTRPCWSTLGNRRRSRMACGGRLLDAVLREPMRERGLARAREFSWERPRRRSCRNLPRAAAGRRATSLQAGRRPRRPSALAWCAVALVHDWLTGMRGGEKVLERLCELFPDADLFTLVHVPERRSRRHRRPAHRTSFLAARCRRRAASTATTCRLSRPPSSSSTSTASTSSSRRSHCAAKSVVGPAGVPPPLLLPHADALRLGPVRRLLRAANGWAGRRARCCARCWPAGPLGPRTATASTAISPSLSTLRGGSRRYYNRESVVVYPPVDTEFFTPDGDRRRRARPSSWFRAGALQAGRRGHRRLPPAPECRSTSSAQGPSEAGSQRAWRRARRARSLGRLDDEAVRASVPHGRRGAAARAKRTSASCRSRRRPAAGPWWPWAAAAPLETVVDGVTGVLVRDDAVEALAARLWRTRPPAPGTRRASARTPSGSATRGSAPSSATPADEVLAAPRRHADGKALQPPARRAARR